MTSIVVIANWVEVFIAATYKNQHRDLRFHNILQTYTSKSKMVLLGHLTSFW